MYSIIVTNKLYAGLADQYLEAMLVNARDSVDKEDGCIRFDVLRDENEKDTFHLYEIYKNAESLTAHKETEHYKRCRQKIERLIKEQSVLRASVITVNPDNNGQ